MKKGAVISLLLISCLASCGVGFVMATPIEPEASEVVEKGLFSTTTSQVLSATVESLRAENKLLVFSYKGTATVRNATDGILFLDSEQELFVPAGVNYYLDLSELTLANVTFDEKAKLVKVQLPKLQFGDVAFQPENAKTVNGGLLTYSEAEAEELRKLNYAAARKAMIVQAQGEVLVANAKRQAEANVAKYFEIPLRIVGQPDVKVVATFK